MITTEHTRQHYNFTLAILTMAGTAYALQQTMVFPALATFERHFHTTPAWATWVLTALAPRRSSRGSTSCRPR